jgi:CRISPR-associated endonuclease/helicase Cas3
MTTSLPGLIRDPLAHLTGEGRPHLLSDHLREVGAGAARFAEVFGAADWARLAGLWHDLGKYSITFQNMIREANGFEARLDGDPGGPRDHSTAGAVHAAMALGASGTPIAFAIAGHHAGLSNQQDLSDRLRSKAQLLDHAKQGGAPAAILAGSPLALPAHIQGSTPEHQRLREMWTRMLFSALCDADFLDTEAFYDQGFAALRGGKPSIAELEPRLTRYLDALQAGASDSEVNRVRAEVRHACIAIATAPPGIFSLTVPTGGGKTLASLAFALAHARAHGLGRVIVAIPFTSIIEQSAETYRTALGDDGVIEHHSAFDPMRETLKNRVAGRDAPLEDRDDLREARVKSRLASENWDAPVVVTTTVQLFESLFANRPRNCRKLHRLARSVIVLDEAQTLPPALLAPILDGLGTLVRHFGASIVICTATQPAFGRTPWLPVGFETVQEIVPTTVNAFDRLRRVHVRWPASEDAIGYEALAVEIAKERDVLAIVHLRKDARTLCEALDQQLGDDKTLHLSALMCPEHRSRVLAEIKRRKQGGEPIRLVATQLIEAGVDVDFALVYRALGGMDALAQAAGRCNREGKLPGLGELRIFHAPTAPPEGVPQAALKATQLLRRKHPALDLLDPSTYTAYFELLYSAKDLDAKKIQDERRKHNFKDVAERFKLIEDDWSAPVVVPYGKAMNHMRDLERFGPSRDRLRALQRFTVTVSKKDRDAWLAAKLAREVQETVVVIDATLSVAYDERFGLVPERVGRGDAGAFVV